MKLGSRFVLRVFSIFLIIFSLQGNVHRVNAELSSISPPPTQSPQDTYSAFLKNTDDAYTLIMEAHRKSQAEGGIRASEEVLTLADQADEAMDRAIETLNLERVPLVEKKSRGIELVLLLRETLDRIEKPEISSIPDAQVVKDIGLDEWEIPNTRIAIVKANKGFRDDEFLFSEETLHQIRYFYEEVKDLPYKENALEGFYQFYVGTPGVLLPPKWSHALPQWSQRTVWDQTLWQWVSFFVLALLVITSIYLAYRVTKIFISDSSQHDIPSQAEAWRGLIMPVAIALNCVLSEHLLINVFNLTGGVAAAMTLLLESTLYIVLAWLGFMFFNALGRSVVAGPYFDEEHRLEATISRNGFRLLGFSVAITLLYVGGQRVGLPTGPLVASLGVGGLAISFGIQPYLKNLIGGITMFASRPVSIGDFCELGGVTGTVEDIELRSKSIRTSDRTLVIIPNSVVSESRVINYSRRDRWLMNFVVNLRHKTPRQQVINIINQIQDHLDLDEMIVNNYVRLISLERLSLDVEISAYVLTTNYADYLQIKEGVLVKIMEIIEGNHVEPATEFSQS